MGFDETERITDDVLYRKQKVTEFCCGTAFQWHTGLG